ncbi:unnamed protein product [Trifolium pratense]|uniref:Uncharacterized protein n=1 Tax=Trifolium pratense TaxID=57577 RepID=A0ACB0IJ70_TRIPR|nr:unnamed protein product [Trifolium pratense]
MVLSKKKLKQKLRTELTLNQINAESNPPSSSSNSLKHHINSSINKPILSKREKLRKIRPLQQPNENEGTKNNEIGIEGLEKKNIKKRKRNDVDVVANEVVVVVKDTNKSVKKNDGDVVVANEVVVKRVKQRVKPRWIREDEVKEKINEIGTEGLEKMKIRKRKRVKPNDGDVVANEVVAVKDTVKVISKSMKKKEQQKKKNMQKKNRKKNKASEENGKTVEASSKIAEENASNHQEELPQSNGLANTNITASQENGDASTKVYVGGIPYYSSEDDIRSYFEGCGTITEINCMTFPDTGKFRGIAIISYKTEAAAKRALALDGADMGGLFLRIQPYKATQATRFTPELKEGYNRIYVGSLSWEITEEELRKFFSNCNIKSIRLGTDKETGDFRGYAHVDFSDSKSLKTALALDQSVLFGRPVRISCAVPLKKKPDAGEKSVADSKQGAGEKSVAGSKPGAVEKSVAGSGEKSVASSKPDAGEKSAAGEKPDAGEKETVEKPPSSVVSGGKRKNRMCYGCRQKGHNLSECPNQQAVASATI